VSSSPLNTWSSLHLISLEHHPLLILSSLFLYGIIPLDSFDSVDCLSDSIIRCLLLRSGDVIISMGVYRSVVYAQLLHSLTCMAFFSAGRCLHGRSSVSLVLRSPPSLSVGVIRCGFASGVRQVSSIARVFEGFTPRNKSLSLYSLSYCLLFVVHYSLSGILCL
jgi:hypothetical protein